MTMPNDMYILDITESSTIRDISNLAGKLLIVKIIGNRIDLLDANHYRGHGKGGYQRLSRFYNRELIKLGDCRYQIKGTSIILINIAETLEQRIETRLDSTIYWSKAKR